MLAGGFDTARRLLEFPSPVVIGCTGHAIAMGSFLCSSGDYRIGTAGPYKIMANEVAIGLTMPYTAIEICRHRLAPAHFHRAVALAESYAPEEAVEAGFLDRVAIESELAEVVTNTANGLASLQRGAHSATKMRGASGGATGDSGGDGSGQPRLRVIAHRPGRWPISAHSEPYCRSHDMDHGGHGRLQRPASSDHRGELRYRAESSTPARRAQRQSVVLACDIDKGEKQQLAQGSRTCQRAPAGPGEL